MFMGPVIARTPLKANIRPARRRAPRASFLTSTDPQRSLGYMASPPSFRWRDSIQVLIDAISLARGQPASMLLFHGQAALPLGSIDEIAAFSAFLGLSVFSY